MPHGPIQPRLPGFLDLLQLKSKGRQPDGLLEDVRAVMDVSTWYGFDRMETISGTATIIKNILTNGSAAFASIPPDETWLLWGHSITLAYATTTITNLQVWDLCCMVQPYTSTIPYRLPGRFNAFDSAVATAFPASSANILGASAWLEKPILLPPQSYYGFCREVLITDPTNDGTVNARFIVTKLQF